MAATHEYFPFAVGAGANTLSPSAYAALSATLIALGFQPGIALSEQMNTVLRQLSTAAVGTVKFAADHGDVNMPDDGNINTVASGILSAVMQLIRSNSVREGAICAYARATPPPGWIECNGQAISRTTYAGLFLAIGDVFGPGDGSTTFNVPDLRGEFIRGWDHGRGADPGRVFATLQGDEFRAHTHGGVPLQTGDVDRGTQSSLFSIDGVGVTGVAGGGETRPRNVALLYCIKH